MNIVFLDHQLLASIRSHVTLRTTQGVDIARTVDHEKYSLSSTLAIFNKHLIKGDLPSGSLASDEKETKVLDKFYKKAHLESEVVQNNESSPLISFTHAIQQRLNRCLPFILFVQQCVNQSEEHLNKDILQEEIFAQAAQFRVENANPLIILSMAALYGHPLAQAIFNNKKQTSKAHLSDTQLGLINIFLLPDLVSIYSKQIWLTSDTSFPINYTLLTLNEAYNELMTALQISGQPELSNSQVDCAFDINITADLFPAIADDESNLRKLVASLMKPIPDEHEPNKLDS